MLQATRRVAVYDEMVPSTQLRLSVNLPTSLEQVIKDRVALIFSWYYMSVGSRNKKAVDTGRDPK